MYREDYSVVIPKFKEVKVSIDELGAVSGKLDVKTGHDNAVIINNAIRSLSENGGGTVIVPAGIWACAPIRLLSGINLHLESQAMLKFIKSKEDYPLIITNYEGQQCIRAVSPVTAENAENIAITDTPYNTSANLIGLVSAYLPYREVLCSTQTHRDRMISEENSGLTVVVSVDSIKEVVEIERT